MQQLLYIETVLKLTGGLVLVFMPLMACRVLGLPRPKSGLWPRLLGAVLLGLAGATYIEGGTELRGLGMAGCAIINLVSVIVILSLIALDGAGVTRRAKASMALLSVTLMVLGILEIAQI
ncbi:MAG: ABC transporter permease [Filomicrobium sp.]